MSKFEGFTCKDCANLVRDGERRGGYCKVRKYVRERNSKQVSKTRLWCSFSKLACLDFAKRTDKLKDDEPPKTYAELQAENAALRERLDKAVELPCKIGDILYTVTITFSDSYEGDIIVRRNGISLSETVVTEKNIWRMCELIRIGKAFFSKEEATAQLKEL